MTILRVKITITGESGPANADALPHVTVTRDDTDAVILDDVEMTNTSVGHYSSPTFNGEDGATYTGTVTGSIDGEPFECEKAAEVDEVVEIAAYNTLAGAREIAGRLGLVKVSAATDAALRAAMELSCIDLDSAMRYQGGRYEADQEREFPRVDGTRIVDLDSDGLTAIVPAAVKTAEAIQAESILTADRNERLQAIADGVVSQSIGNQAESYQAGIKAQPLCQRAFAMMSKYRLRSGQLL